MSFSYFDAFAFGAFSWHGVAWTGLAERWFGWLRTFSRFVSGLSSPKPNTQNLWVDLEFQIGYLICLFGAS